MKQSKKKGINLIKKSNDLIESRYKFDIWETRFFHSVLSMIGTDDNEFQPYRIYFRDIIDFYELKPTSSYELLRNAAKSLMNQKVTINYEENGHKREKIYHLLRYVDVLKEGRAGAKDIEQHEYIDVVVEDHMRPFLLQLQRNFTTFENRITKRLGSTSTRIYEFIKQYQAIGHRKLYIDDMKQMMQMETEYPKFSNFYQKVITPSVRDINKYTDIKITSIDRVKEGRKTVALHFRFEPQTQLKVQKKEVAKGKLAVNPELFDQIEVVQEEIEVNIVAEPTVVFSEPETPFQSEQDRLFVKYQDEIVRGFGVSPTVLIMELGSHSEEALLQAIRVTKAAIKDGKAKNNAAFFVEALRQGFTNPQEVELQKRAAAAEMKLFNDKIDTEIENIQDAQARVINDKIRELIETRPEIRDEAIVLVNSSLTYQILIKKKEKELDRALAIVDFRQDKTLVAAVKAEIIKANKSEFASIASFYETQILALQAQKKK
jgi:plasmid replication initiation protein